MPATSGEELTIREGCKRSDSLRSRGPLSSGCAAGRGQAALAGLLHDLGRKLGQLAQALADFDHPAVHRDFHWDLANGNRVVNEFAGLIDNASLRELVLKCRFEPPASLRRSVIHGDANDYNLLVDPESMTVTGLIDFGDMVYSYTVGDLAIAIAYVILDKTDPHAAAAEIVEGYRSEFELREDELEALWPLVRLRLAMSVCLAAHQLSSNLKISICRSARRAIEENLPRIYADERRFIKERQRLLGRNLSVAYEKPLNIVRGSMQYLFDDEGRRYLDAYNNVAHVGHCHPKVVAAGQRQMELLNTNTRYLSDLILEYAEKLTATLPEPLSVCYFVNSGSEANELAIRLARAHTKAREMIVLDHAYHGNTTTLIDLSPYKHNGPGGEGAPSWVHTVPLPDLYRGIYRVDDPEAAKNTRNTLSMFALKAKVFVGFLPSRCRVCPGRLFFLMAI